MSVLYLIMNSRRKKLDIVDGTNILSVCFILDHVLMPYRLPFFEGIVEKGFSVTVMHTGKVMYSNSKVKEHILQKKTFAKFEYRKLPNISNYDIVVHMQNLRILNFWILTLNPFRNFKLIHWGIGTSSSNGLKLKKNFISLLRNFLATFSSAQVLYTDYALPLFSNFVRNKTFIANNTIFNPNFKDLSLFKKNCFIFIGSLNKRKCIEILINSFCHAQNIGIGKLELLIIGDGPEKQQLQILVDKLQINDSVKFLGSVSNFKLKEKYFQRALACISPKQAGLSVLESFSYGVPFICFKDAISGGEHLNILNGNNGYLVNSNHEIVEKMVMLDRNRDLAKSLGHNAFLFYKNKMQMSNMINDFVKSFHFVLQN